MYMYMYCNSNYHYYFCQVVSSNATITDIDSTQVGRLTVSTLSNLEHFSWVELPGISYSNDTQGVITFTGLQSISVYEELIRSFTFADTDDEPSLEPRVVLFQVFTSVDGNGVFSTSNVAQTSITIVPINDMNPVFDQASYQGFVDENRPPGTAVGVTILATDTDALSDAIITYSILGGSDYFTVDPNSGVVTTTAMLDAEESSTIEFTIVATENSEPSLTSTAPVTISVGDINDNAPQFGEPAYNISVFEDTPIKEILLAVQATDDDISSSNSELMYYLAESEMEVNASILDNDLALSINSTTGEIALEEFLDFEEAQELTFYIVAIDLGSPPLTSSVPLIIEVIDVNDNVPVLEPLYEATPSEDTPTGTVIATITAQDADSGTVLTYSLSGLGSESFEIDPTLGEVSVKSSLDYETTPNYSLIVSVNDGLHSVSSMLQVLLININDNPPVIDKPLEFSMPENVDFELLINATDADGDLLEYSITEGSGQCALLNIFIMNGRIYNTVQFDRELQGVCWFVVTVSDGVFNDSSNITIYITDENDNLPTFDQEVYSVDVFDRLFENRFVTQVQASDADVGEVVVYSIVSQSDQLFQISTSDGIITTAVPLSLASERQYNVTVGAGNLGTNDITSTALVTIELINTVAPNVSLYQPPIYVEESGLVSIASNIILVSRDGMPLLGARIQFTDQACLGSSACQSVHNDLNCLEYCGEALAINATAVANLDVLIDNSTIAITGNGSASEYQGILSTLAYININDEPTTTTQFTINVYDSLVSSYELHIDLVISNVDDHCPLVSAATNNLTFVENSGLLAIGEGASIAISDGDAVESHQVLSSLTINVSGLIDEDFESINITSTDAISAIITKPSLDTSIITLTGQASISTYQDILKSLIYTNTRSEPTLGSRTLTLTPSHDGMCSALKLYLTVELSNDNPPLITINSTSIVYEEGSGPVPFSQAVGLVISDDDKDFLLYSATVNLKGNSDASEGLSIVVDAPVAIEANLTAISITGQGSVSLYQTLLHAVMYNNPTSNPTPGNRTISITVYDGEHNAVTVVLVMVVRINDNPLVLSSNILRFSFVEGNTTLALDTVTVSDEDKDAMVYNLSISLSSQEQDKEYISVSAFGSVITDPALIEINQPASIADYQVPIIITLQLNFLARLLHHCHNYVTML